MPFIFQELIADFPVAVPLFFLNDGADLPVKIHFI